MKYISSKKKPISSQALVSALSLVTGAVLAPCAVASEEKIQQLDTIHVTADHDSYYVKESNNTKIAVPLLDTARTINVISKRSN